MHTRIDPTRTSDTTASSTIKIVPSLAKQGFVRYRTLGTPRSSLKLARNRLVTGSTNNLEASRSEVLEGIREGLQDIIHGRVYPIEELWDSLGSE